MCACACAGGADQEPAHNDKAGECYLSSMQLLQLKDDAECSAVGNYLLAAALAGSAPHIVRRPTTPAEFASCKANRLGKHS